MSWPASRRSILFGKKQQRKRRCCVPVIPPQFHFHTGGSKSEASTELFPNLYSGRFYLTLFYQWNQSVIYFIFFTLKRKKKNIYSPSHNVVFLFLFVLQLPQPQDGSILAVTLQFPRRVIVFILFYFFTYLFMKVFLYSLEPLQFQSTWFNRASSFQTSREATCAGWLSRGTFQGNVSAI